MTEHNYDDMIFDRENKKMVGGWVVVVGAVKTKEKSDKMYLRVVGLSRASDETDRCEIMSDTAIFLVFKIEQHQCISIYNYQVDYLNFEGDFKVILQLGGTLKRCYRNQFQRIDIIKS